MGYKPPMNNGRTISLAYPMGESQRLYDVLRSFQPDVASHLKHDHQKKTNVNLHPFIRSLQITSDRVFGSIFRCHAFPIVSLCFGMWVSNIFSALNSFPSVHLAETSTFSSSRDQP